jgi:hypothetical protein
MTLANDILTDLDSFINTDEFAKSVTYAPTIGTPKTVNVIFDNAFYEAHLLGAPVDSMNPSCEGKESDFIGISGNDVITIEMVTYYVVGYEPDGTGIIKIVLSKDRG